MIVGNKLDLVVENPKLRCVPQIEVQRFCKERDFLYFETSAKQGNNVKTSFEKLIEKIYNNSHKLQETETQELTIKNEQTKCCT